MRQSVNQEPRVLEETGSGESPGGKFSHYVDQKGNY